MSSLFRVELLAVADEYLVGQIYTVAVGFYDPADNLARRQCRRRTQSVSPQSD